MFTKLYDQIIKYIKKEYKFLLTLLIILLISTIKLPYYIDIPGGIINISDRISIDQKKLSGTLNFAYVSELRATIPTLIIEKLNKDWDLVDFDDIIVDNENDAKFRDELSLKEAVSNALYVGFSESGEKFEISNDKIYVTYIYENAETDLKIGDQIIKIDDKIINSKKDLSYVQTKNVGEKVNITVINNDKEYIRKANLIELDKKVLVGVGIGETFDIESNHDINISYKARESGPSGGMMMALTIYSYLTDTDLTKGRKVVGTGTIDTNGNVGSIGGVKYKLMGAVKNKADIFLVPSGENYEEAIKLKNEKHYNIDIYSVKNFKEAIEILNK